MSVTKLHSFSDLQEVTRSKHLSVIDYFTTWCNPCKVLAPKMEQLARSYPQVSFYKVDVDEMNDAASTYNISAMPTIHFWKDGKMVGEVVGADYNKIKRYVDAYS